MPEELPSAADLRQCIEALNKPISPYFLKYRQAKTGDMVDLGEHKNRQWRPAPQSGLYFETYEDEFFHLNLSGREKFLGTHETNGWRPAPPGGIYFDYEDEFFYLDLNGRVKSLGGHEKHDWNPAPCGGIYFDCKDELFHLDHNDQMKSLGIYRDFVWYPAPQGGIYLFRLTSEGFLYLDHHGHKESFFGLDDKYGSVGLWKPAYPDGINFIHKDSFFHLDLAGQAKPVGEYRNVLSWHSAPCGGIYFVTREREFVYLDLNGQEKSFGTYDYLTWYPAPHGIYFENQNHFYLLVHKIPAAPV